MSMVDSTATLSEDGVLREKGIPKFSDSLHLRALPGQPAMLVMDACSQFSVRLLCSTHRQGQKIRGQ